jgi:hypothetical protein
MPPTYQTISSVNNFQRNQQKGTRMANPRQAERDTIEAGHEATRRAADQASQVGRTMSDAAENTARAGSEAFRRNAESIGRSWQESSQAATRIAERSMDQFSRLFGLSGDGARETMQQSAGNVQALIDSSTAGCQRSAERVRGMGALRTESHRGKPGPLRRASGLPHAARMHGASDANRPR